MTEKKRIIISASPQGAAVAEPVRKALADEATCEVWSRGVLSLSGPLVSRFLDLVRAFDAAVVVVRAGDLSATRTADRLGARDYLFFELGLVVGALRGRPVVVLYDHDAPLDLPAELTGVRAIKLVAGSDGVSKGAIDLACHGIRRALAGGPAPDRAATASAAPAEGEPRGFLGKLSNELASASAGLDRSSEQIRRKAGFPGVSPATDGGAVSDAPLGDDLPGARAEGQKLRFLEGMWRNPETDAVGCGREIEGEMRFVYSLGGKAATGEFHDWHLVGEDEVVGRFRWLSRALDGFVHFRLESRKRLVGGWWYTSTVPPRLVGELPSVERKVVETWERQPLSRPFPDWAEEFFRKLQLHARRGMAP
jgi:Predicted nucleotide-binding protein containing TIR-like domain